MAGEEFDDYGIPIYEGEEHSDNYGGQAYRGRGQTIHNGKYVFGTGAAEDDINRFREMGSRRGTGAQIDQSQSNETRGLQMGSLAGLEAGASGTTSDMTALNSAAYGNTADMGYLSNAAGGNSNDLQLLQGAAEGRSPSRAEILGKQMSDRALRSQVAAAGTVRGGPGASAAAYRYASQNAGTQRADMNAGIQAERASEMAHARDAYANYSGTARRDFAGASGAARRDYAGAAGAARRDYAGATTAARGQDIGLATSQAELAQHQHDQDLQQERFYEQLASDTAFGDLHARQGSQAADTTERHMVHAEENAEKQQDINNRNQTMSNVSGMVSGGVSTADTVHRWDERHTSSDVRSKAPVTWGSLAPLSIDAAKPGESKAKTEDVRDLGEVEDWGKDNNPEPDAKPASWLSDYMGEPKDTTGNYSGGIYRSFPEEESAYKGGLTRGVTYDGETTLSDKRAKTPAQQSAYLRGARAAKDGVIDGGELDDDGPFRPAPSMSDAIDAKQREGRRDPTSFHVDTPDEQRGIVRGYQDKAGKEADAYIAALRTPSNQMASVSRPEGELDSDPAREPASWLATYMDSQQPQRTTMVSDKAAKEAAYQKGVTAGADLEREAKEARETADGAAKRAGMALLIPGMQATVPGHAVAAAYLSSEADKASLKASRAQNEKRRAAGSAGAAPPSHPDVIAARGDARALEEMRALEAQRKAPPTLNAPDQIGTREVERGAPRRSMVATDITKGDREVFYSDEHAKTKLDRTDKAMAGAARSMEPSAYVYKPGFAERSGQTEGEVNVGPMANNMAENPVAKTAIVKDPDTGLLAIDKDKGLKVVMGSLASLQHQIDALDDGPRADSAKRPRRARSAAHA
jgi:hypothetical protein